MPEYTVESLDHGIAQAEKNIKTFEDAIGKEHETIGQFKWMKEQSQRKEAQRANAKIHKVNIVVNKQKE